MEIKMSEPNPSSLVESIRDIGYTLDSAVADLVDNSISAGASKLEIYTDYDDVAETIKLAILDNGKGLTKDELIRAMAVGSRSPLEERDLDDLGRFGLGLKTASFSQCRKLTVVSSVGGNIACAQWDLNYVAYENKWHLKLYSGHEVSTLYRFDKLEENGTLVIWEDCDRIIDNTSNPMKTYHERLEVLEEHLKLTFHRFLENKKLSISINGSTPISYYDPFATKFEATQKLPTEQVNLNGKNVVIRPFILPHHSKVSEMDYELNGGHGGYISNQGFYVYRNKRLLIHGTWFRMKPKSDLSKLTRIMIDLPNNLDGLWKIDVKKSQASPPQIIKEKLKSIVESISGKSVRVYKFRGHRQSTVKEAYWTKEQARGKVKYSVNLDHPDVVDFKKALTGDQKQEFETLIKDIAAFFPVDLLYSDYGSSPNSIDQKDLSDADLERRALEYVEKFKDDFSMEEILAKFRKLEPYVHYTKSWKEFLDEYV